MFTNRLTRYSDPVVYSDELLFSLVQQLDDQAAFAELYSRYWDNMLDVAFKRLASIQAAEEVVQDIFVELYVRRKEVQLTVRLSSYLMTALKYKIFNAYRAQQTHHKYVDSIMHEVLVDDHNPQESLQTKELSNRITAAAALMPEKCRQVFFLSRYQYLPQQLIAERLGITLSTVKKHLTKALRILRAELADYRQDMLLLVTILQLLKN